MLINLKRNDNLSQTYKTKNNSDTTATWKSLTRSLTSTEECGWQEKDSLISKNSSSKIVPIAIVRKQLFEKNCEFNCSNAIVQN